MRLFALTLAAVVLLSADSACSTERELVDAMSEARRNSPTIKTPRLKQKAGGKKLDKPTFGETFMLKSNHRGRAVEEGGQNSYICRLPSKTKIKIAPLKLQPMPGDVRPHDSKMRGIGSGRRRDTKRD